MEHGPCRYCGEELVGPAGGHTYVSATRRDFPKSVIGVRCNEGECLNAAGQVTQHDPVRA